MLRRSNTTPVVLNHMGALYGQPAPPNLLEAAAAGLAVGAAIVAVDINALGGGDYLLVHDLDLDGETSGNGAVQALPLLRQAGVDLFTTNTPRALVLLLGKSGHCQDRTIELPC